MAVLERIRAGAFYCARFRRFIVGHFPTVPLMIGEQRARSKMLGFLDKLWAKLSHGERDERKKCYQDARKYISTAPADGINAPLKKTFQASDQ